MKYISRRTALLLALIMLMTTVTAFGDSVSIDALDADQLASWYNLQSSGACAADNAYCAAVSELSTFATDKARYESLLSEYGEDADTLTLILDHYYHYHYLADKDATLLCICNSIASSGAADENGLPLYAPGSIAHEEACPWYGSNVYYNDQVISGFVTLQPYENLADKDSYAFLWYDESGNALTSDGEPYELNVQVTFEEKIYRCDALLDGQEQQSRSCYVSAQTKDLEQYLGFLLDYYDYENDAPDAAVIYSYMVNDWNIALANGDNLAKNILSYWAEDPIPEKLFCTCVHEGKANADACMLHPDAAHDVSCGWYTGSPVLELKAETDETGSLLYYVLTATLEGETTVIAQTEMLDGVHHYFKDVASGLFVAWLKTDENGVQWIVPLESENN